MTPAGSSKACAAASCSTSTDAANTLGFGINDKGRKALEQAHMSNVSETVSESQTRCVAIYRAAGWTGEYDARDLHGFEGDDG